MRSLWFRLPGQGDRAFYKCPVCRMVHGREQADGVFVRVANEVVMIVCVGDCAARVQAQLSESFPCAFPNVDGNGVLLGDFTLAPVVALPSKGGLS